MDFYAGNFTLKSDLARKRFEQQATEKLIAIKGIFRITL